MIGDITYIPTWEGWLYLATVIDVHTREVVGYAMDDNYKTPLISAALHHAASRSDLQPDAIFHSDRRSNYTSTEFAATMKALGMRQSMGRTGTCYDCEHPGVAATGGLTPATTGPAGACALICRPPVAAMIRPLVGRAVT